MRVLRLEFLELNSLEHRLENLLTEIIRALRPELLELISTRAVNAAGTEPHAPS